MYIWSHCNKTRSSFTLCNQNSYHSIYSTLWSKVRHKDLILLKVLNG